MRLSEGTNTTLALSRVVFVATLLVFSMAASPARVLAFDLFDDDAATATARSIEAKLAGLEDGNAGDNALQSQVLAFYQARDYRPAWSGSDRAQRWAKHVRYTLEHAYEQGLRPSDYQILLPDSDAAQESGDAAAAYDIAMSTALLRYAHDVRTGRFAPSDIYNDVDLPPQRFDAARQLNSALRHSSLDDFLGSLPPAHVEYRGLVAALALYRGMAERGERPDGDTSKSVSYRMQQIAANMERWRWMPAQLERRYIQVDVPDQELDYVRDGQIVLQSRVVIGRRATPTPILRTVVQAVIANPAWDIADDIAIRQILPRIRASHDYLATHDITFENGQFHQAPGPHNALGLLMLDAPNPFWVYMHDTPDKRLFSLETREYSNGCVRVEQIFPLASLALTDDPDAGSDSLNQAIASGQTEQLLLPDPLPVYMVYWTARADEDGTVDFHPDRYGRDTVLIAKLGLGAPAAAKKRVATAPAHSKSRPTITLRPVSLEIPAGHGQGRAH